MRDVAYWPEADMKQPTIHVRLSGESGRDAGIELFLALTPMRHARALG